VDYLKQFVIQFRGLKNESHHFDFVIDKKFFDAIEYAELEQGTVNVSVDLIKEERMMIFEFGISGEVEVECDRCLDPFFQPINGTERLIVKFGEEYEEQSDDVIIIPESDYKFDLTTYIYEYIRLMLPMQCIHPDDDEGYSTCNQEMLDRLSVENEEPTIDPRWDALKKLKENK
jgi:uncharacterized metal-binding protein YceD (DUF177 family)